MTARQAATVWRAMRKRELDAVSRHITYGELEGEHVVEIEPRHAIRTSDFRFLLDYARAQNLELTYGTVSRRVLVLS